MPPRRLLVLLVAALACGAAGARQPGAPLPMEYVRVVDRPWERVAITVTVTDARGRPVRGLTAADFVVTDGGRAVEIADFGPEEGRRDRPLSVAVLLDLSASMAGQVRRVEEAARALL